MRLHAGIGCRCCRIAACKFDCQIKTQRCSGFQLAPIPGHAMSALVYRHRYAGHKQGDFLPMKKFIFAVLIAAIAASPALAAKKKSKKAVAARRRVASEQQREQLAVRQGCLPDLFAELVDAALSPGEERRVCASSDSAHETRSAQAADTRLCLPYAMPVSCTGISFFCPSAIRQPAKPFTAAAALAGDACSAGANNCNSERLIAISRVGDAIFAPSRSVT